MGPGVGNRAEGGVLRGPRGAARIKIVHNFNKRCGNISALLQCHVKEHVCYLVGIQEPRNSMWVGKGTLAAVWRMDWIGAARSQGDK